jgi:hypothetical protein
MHLILSPAYSREYKSRKEILTAFSKFRDFEVVNSSIGYVNLTDLEAMPYWTGIQVRYGKNLTQSAAWTRKQFMAAMEKMGVAA